MGKGEETYNPLGSNEYQSLLKSMNKNYNTLQDYFTPTARNLYSMQDTMYQNSPEFQKQLNNNMNTMYNMGEQNISNSYAPRYRQNTQNLAKNFGGINNSVARDTQSEIAGQEQSALSDLAKSIEMQRYNLQQQELANNQQKFQNYLSLLSGTQSYGGSLANVARGADALRPFEYDNGKGTSDALGAAMQGYQAGSTIGGPYGGIAGTILGAGSVYL